MARILKSIEIENDHYEIVMYTFWHDMDYCYYNECRLLKNGETLIWGDSDAVAASMQLAQIIFEAEKNGKKVTILTK